MHSSSIAQASHIGTLMELTMRAGNLTTGYGNICRLECCSCFPPIEAKADATFVDALSAIGLSFVTTLYASVLFALAPALIVVGAFMGLLHVLFDCCCCLQRFQPSVLFEMIGAELCVAGLELMKSFLQCLYGLIVIPFAYCCCRSPESSYYSSRYSE